MDQTRRRSVSEAAASTVEYGLLVGLIALTLVVAFAVLR